MNMLVIAYRNAWIKERKLHMCWRAIARRQLSRLRELEVETDAWFWAAREASDGA